MVEYIEYQEEQGPKLIKLGKFSTSNIELVHITLALIMIIITLMILNRGLVSNIGLKDFVIIYLSTIGTGFLFHEMAHKLVAQHYKFISEFRADFLMMFFAMILAFTGFTFLAPGAVIILANRISRKQNGIISVAGPVTNLILAIIFLLMLFFALPTQNNFLITLSYVGIQINSFLGIFNMLPFWILDGKKVLAWSKSIYFLVLGLLILSYFSPRFIF